MLLFYHLQATRRTHTHTHTHRSSACVTAHTPSPLLRSSSVAIVLRRCPSGHRLQHGPRREDTARRYGTDGKQASKQKQQQQPSTPIFMRRSNIESEISWPSPEHHRTPRAHKTLHDHAPPVCVCVCVRSQETIRDHSAYVRFAG